MLSKRISRYIKSLQLKKYRKQEGSFVVEGAKGVLETLKSDFEVQILLYTEDFREQVQEFSDSHTIESYLVSQKELEQVGSFKSNNAGLLVAKCKSDDAFIVTDGLTLALDDVRDPGNLGTIIRIADWYGIKNIVCSEECADMYNPKVISASMGSFTRVSLSYTNLESFLDQIEIPVYGALLDGQPIYDRQLSGAGIVVMGSESHGIGDSIRAKITDPIQIPRRGGAESLNVAVATAVILDNFFR